MNITHSNNGNSSKDEYNPSEVHELLNADNDIWAQMDINDELIERFVTSQEVKENLGLDEETETDN